MEGNDIKRIAGIGQCCIQPFQGGFGKTPLFDQIDDLDQTDGGEKDRIAALGRPFEGFQRH